MNLEVEDKDLLIEKTVGEHARRERAFSEREVLIQAKLNKQESETQLRIGKIEALQLRLEYIDQKIAHAKEKLLLFPESKALNQQINHQILKEINDFEIKQTQLRNKIKEEEIGKREAEKDVLEMQQAIHFLEDEKENWEAVPSNSMQIAVELEKQIEHSQSKIRNSELQVKAINNKIKEFTHLMDKLIEENQILKRMIDERKEHHTRNAFEEIGNTKNIQNYRSTGLKNQNR